MSGLIGILCGLKSEARIADRLPNVLVGCSAADPERAQSLAYHMVEKGVSRLISFGLAGATSPDLCAGDLVIEIDCAAATLTVPVRLFAAFVKARAEPVAETLVVPDTIKASVWLTTPNAVTAKLPPTVTLELAVV